jgi:hypothetical protein
MTPPLIAEKDFRIAWAEFSSWPVWPETLSFQEMARFLTFNE